MTDHDDLRFSLGSYLAGALDSTARGELEAHLGGCDECRNELAELSRLPRFLARLSSAELESAEREDDLLTPPPSLLPGLLSRARAVEAAGRRRLWRWRVAAAGMGLAAAVAALVIVLPATSPLTPAGASYQLHPSVGSTGVSGEVRLDGRPWGTEVALSMRGLPPGTNCVAVVAGRDGHTEVLGNWGPTPNHAATVLVTTGLPSTGLAKVTIQTTAGRPLLSADVPSS
ncbi:MAG: hypothetical protein NVSMB29_11230 [Candidatus Dormibacteria bacterium]